MNTKVTCPVCDNVRELPQGAEGKKWQCGQCTSVHRILKDDSGYALKTLEEALYTRPEEPAAVAAEAAAGTADHAKVPVGPKLVTRRDRMRSEEHSAPRRSPRTTRSRSRR